jgi:hypothetical protein
MPPHRNRWGGSSLNFQIADRTTGAEKLLKAHRRASSFAVKRDDGGKFGIFGLGLKPAVFGERGQSAAKRPEG